MVAHVSLAIVALFCVIPVIMMLSGAFRTPGSAASQLVPWPLSLGNIIYVLNTVPVAGVLWSTFLIAITTMAGQILIALLASYAFGVWRFWGDTVLYVLFIGVWLIPKQVTMIPNFVTLVRTGLLNTLPGVILPLLLSAMSVAMMRNYVRSFPTEILESARMDGRSSWTILWTILVPNLKPALISLAILQFVTSWNEYFWASVVLSKNNNTIQLALRGFMGAEGNNYGAIMALSGISCVPLFLLYLILQKRVINSFASSGIK